jgi:hypothetical protein
MTTGGKEGNVDVVGTGGNVEIVEVIGIDGFVPVGRKDA